jgi:hypothetical protein
VLFQGKHERSGALCYALAIMVYKQRLLSSHLSLKAHKTFLNELLCSSQGSNALSACHTVPVKSVVCSMQVFTGVKTFTTEIHTKIRDSNSPFISTILAEIPSLTVLSKYNN